MAITKSQQEKLKSYVQKQKASDDTSILRAFRSVVSFLKSLGLRVIADVVSNFIEDHLGILKHAWILFKAWIDGGTDGSLG